MKTDNERIIERLKGSDFTHFCRSHNILLALLFGSRATGSAGEDSDFDLALLVDVDFKKDVWEAAALKRSLLHKLMQFFSSSRVDLTILNAASTSLAHEVTQSGILLFEAEEGTYARFASLVIRRLSDDRLFHEAEKKYIGMPV